MDHNDPYALTGLTSGKGGYSDPILVAAGQTGPQYMRTRTDSDYASKAWSRRVTTYTGAVTDQGGNHDHWNRSWRMDDVEDSDYHARKNVGKLTFNPCEYQSTEIISHNLVGGSVFSWRRTSSSAPWTKTGGFEVSNAQGQTAWEFYPEGPLGERVHSNYAADTYRNLFDYAAVAAKRNEAITGLEAKLSDSDAMALVTAAEMRDTARLIGDTATRAGHLFNFLNRFPTRVIRDAAKLTSRELKKIATKKGSSRSLGRLASTWLEARYGWQAAYYDVQNILSATPNGRNRKRFERVLKDSYDSGPIETETQFSLDNMNSTLKMERARYQRYTSISAGAVVQLNLDYAQLDAYGARRIFSSAWELVPFSFVVDWFVDVGDKLAAVDSSILVDKLGSWVTTRHSLLESRSRTVGVNEDPPELLKKVTGDFSVDASRVDSCTHYIREAHPSMSVIPSISVKLDAKRITDAAALLKSNSRRLARALRA